MLYIDELDTDNEYDLERLHDDILELCPSDTILGIISAGNINWRGASGLRVIDPTDDSENILHLMAGIQGDYSISNLSIGIDGVTCIVSSHDIPCGGSRRLQWLNASQVLNRIIANGYLADFISDNGYDLTDLDDRRELDLIELIKGLDVIDTSNSGYNTLEDWLI